MKGEWVHLPLSQSPFYLCLKHGEKKIFDEYHNILTDATRNGPKCNPKETSYEKFMELYEDIKNNGLKKTFSPQITKEGVITDGQHRLAILYHLGIKKIGKN
jgi:hypothetical protein